MFDFVNKVDNVKTKGRPGLVFLIKLHFNQKLKKI
jgi:hypothetical protein